MPPAGEAGRLTVSMPRSLDASLACIQGSKPSAREGIYTVVVSDMRMGLYG